jgi:uncharacterized protein (DUF1810 family)
MSKENISRFVQMYDEYYTQVEKELRYGRKESHWMWFIFPQITGLGRSSMAQFYAVKDIGEAKDFLKSSCGERMRNLLQIVLELQNNIPESIFGIIDAAKLQSSMTLFAEAASEDPIFNRVLDKFYSGLKDEKTLEILREQQEKYL